MSATPVPASAPDARTRRARAALLAATFLALAIAAYWRAFTSGFVQDDFALVAAAREHGFFATWFRGRGGFLRPLITLSYLADLRLWGLDPRGFHATNVALHAAAALLLVLFGSSVLRLFGFPGLAAARTAGIAGLLFLLLPSHAESVSWVSGRTDVAAAVLGLLSLAAFSRCASEPTTAATQRRPAWLAVSSLLYLLALYAKESIAPLPGVMLLIVLLAPRPPDEQAAARTAPRDLLPHAGALAFYLFTRYAALGTLVGGYGTAEHLTLQPGLMAENVPRAIVRALLPPLSERAYPLARAAAIAALAIGILWMISARSRPTARPACRWMAFVAGSFVLLLLPALNFPIAVSDTKGERFLYLPSLFLCLGLASGAELLLRRSRALGLALLAGFLSLSFVSLWRTNGIWQEAGALSLRIARSIARTAARADVLVLNAPESYRGIPLFTQGLPQAVRVFSGAARVRRLETFSRHTLRSARGGVLLRYDPASRLGSLALLDPEDRFTEYHAVGPVEPGPATADEIRFRLAPFAAEIDVYVYSGAEMHEVSRALAR